MTKNFKHSLFFLLAGGLFLMTAAAFAEDEAKKPDGAVCIPGGPCFVPSDDAEKESDEAVQKDIDLEKEPWMVESVRLPADHPAFKKEKVVWADKLYMTALPDTLPEIPVEKWLSAPPQDYAGKFVLVEAWATWCPPCRRSMQYLHAIAERYKDDLLVVSICETEEEKLRSVFAQFNLPISESPEDASHLAIAIDTGRRFANALHVEGVPHAVLLDPTMGGVVWEGMPTCPGHELNGEILEKFFAIGKKMKDLGRLPAEPVIKFSVSEPTDEQRATRRHHESDVEDKAGEPSKN